MPKLFNQSIKKWSCGLYFLQAIRKHSIYYSCRSMISNFLFVAKGHAMHLTLNVMHVRFEDMIISCAEELTIDNVWFILARLFLVKLSTIAGVTISRSGRHKPIICEYFGSCPNRKAVLFFAILFAKQSIGNSHGCIFPMIMLFNLREFLVRNLLRGSSRWNIFSISRLVWMFDLHFTLGFTSNKPMNYLQDKYKFYVHLKIWK